MSAAFVGVVIENVVCAGRNLYILDIVRRVWAVGGEAAEIDCLPGGKIGVDAFLVGENIDGLVFATVNLDVHVVVAHHTVFVECEKSVVLDYFVIRLIGVRVDNLVAVRVLDRFALEVSARAEDYDAESVDFLIF